VHRCDHAGKHRRCEALGRTPEGTPPGAVRLGLHVSPHIPAHPESEPPKQIRLTKLLSERTVAA